VICERSTVNPVNEKGMAAKGASIFAAFSAISGNENETLMFATNGAVALSPVRPPSGGVIPEPVGTMPLPVATIPVPVGTIPPSAG